MRDPGEHVRVARRRAGISQRALARRAGTTQAAISRIERGLEEAGFGRFEAIMQSLGYQPTIELRPVANHRAAPRRLLAERRRSPAERITEGITAAKLARRIGQAARANRQ